MGAGQWGSGTECSGLVKTLLWLKHGTAWGGGLCLVGAILSLTHLDPSLQGVITVKGLVDREKADFYTLTVVADDGGPKPDATVVSASLGESPPDATHHPEGTQTPSSQSPNVQARQ